MLPEDPGYDEARSVWNGDIDRRPALVVRCRTAGQVAEAIALARSLGVELTDRGGGHNFAPVRQRRGQLRELHDRHRGGPRQGGLRGGEVRARLARIKAAYDPENVFHRNANIRPAVARA